MKSTKAIVITFSILLIVFGLFIGAYRGWNAERAEVSAAYQTLEEMLLTRAETAANILTVASRHLSAGDEQMKLVADERDILKNKNRSMGEKADANTRLATDANALLQKLAALDTVKADARDNMYVTAMLPQMLDDSGKYVTQTAYNQAAQAFNKRFGDNFISGTLARVLGITPAQEFGAE